MEKSYICKACRTRLSRPRTQLPRRCRTLSTKSQTATTTTTTSTTQPPTSPLTPPPLSRAVDKAPLASLRPSDLSYYWDTDTPDENQLAYADRFFTPSRHSPVKLFSAAQFRTMPLSSTEPEVAFLGRSNVGKSSLMNAIMGQKMCWTSAHPGRTREMNAFGIGGTKGGESKVVLLDMPGYGKASRAQWGAEIMKYLKGRKQLRRTFLLIDGLHGLKDRDQDLLGLLRQNAIPHQIILSKVDRILAKSIKSLRTGVAEPKLRELRNITHGLKSVIQPVGFGEGPGALGEILTCSAEVKVDGKTPLGISAIRWSILTATGFDGSIEALKSEPTAS